MNEVKREKFVSLGEKRTKRAIREIRMIGNLSNKNNYSYNTDDITKITSALEREIRDLKGKFREKSNGNGIDFSLE